MPIKKVVVNSWNEWDPLQHVIVGRPDGTMIQAPEPAIARDFSNNAQMNILMLDPKTVCVDAQEVRQMEQFDQLGFEVISVPFGAVSAFGGGLHCATADVYREGRCDDYFPHPIEGY
jgi:N-dimethylarginine dimethylaminohydrolase